MKRILITGAAGFLGSHLCDRFIKEGYFVIGMDNLITGDLKNIEHLFKLENFEFYHHDITKFVHVPGKLDYILHFASPASPIDYLKIPIQTLKVGSLGTHNLLGLARVKKARILIASTSEVYGDPLVHPQTEEYYGNVNTIGPRGVYDEAKRFQESITMAYHTFHGVETRIVRIFNTYGPRMRLNDGRVIPAFIGQAIRGEDLTIFGDGMQTRSFCYVDDQVEGIYRLLHSDYVYPVNIGNPDEITIKDFAEEIIKLTGTNQKVVYHPLPINDPLQRQPDISKAKEILELVKNISSPEDSIKITLVNGLELIKNYKEKEAQNLYANLLGELSWYEYIKSNYSKAIEIEIKALKIAEKTKDKNLLSNSNLRLGNYYAKIGGEYSDLGSGKERLAFQKMASYHLKEASKLTEMTKDSKLYLKSLASLSNFYLSTKKLDSSKLYSNLILDKAEKDDYKNRAQALNYLGIISYEEKKFNEAEYFFKKSKLKSQK